MTTDAQAVRNIGRLILGVAALAVVLAFVSINIADAVKPATETAAVEAATHLENTVAE